MIVGRRLMLRLIRVHCRNLRGKGQTGWVKRVGSNNVGQSAQLGLSAISRSLAACFSVKIAGLEAGNHALSGR